MAILNFKATFDTTPGDVLRFAKFHGYQESFTDGFDENHQPKTSPNPISAEDYICNLMNEFLSSKLNELNRYKFESEARKQIEENVKYTFNKIKENLSVSATTEQ